MIRARFQVNPADPRPINWPIKHPYWVTGQGDDHATVVAYADDKAEILRNWPDARAIDSEASDSYTFTDRFPRPEWFKDAPQTTAEQTADITKRIHAISASLTLHAETLRQEYSTSPAADVVDQASKLLVTLCQDFVRLDVLTEAYRFCPHMCIVFNDDPAEEDLDGMVPIGYSIEIDGCRPIGREQTVAPTLREAIDKLDAVGKAQILEDE